MHQQDAYRMIQKRAKAAGLDKSEWQILITTNI
jgi:hypothetical protein